jgi:regulator of RNase E activity RraA
VKAWNTAAELYELMRRELYTPVVGDILDTHGLYHQFLPPAIHALREDMRIAGAAMPVLMMDVFEAQEQPFGLMTQALDDLQPNEVYIASGALHRSANWGEIMTATAKSRSAAGAVVNGYHRDTPQVLSQQFPVFSRGNFAQDSGPRMKVADFRVSIEIGGVRVAPGDVVFGDVDGVLIIPADVVDVVVTRALEKARGEKTVRREIENGMSSTEAFRKYGIL